MSLLSRVLLLGLTLRAVFKRLGPWPTCWPLTEPPLSLWTSAAVVGRQLRLWHCHGRVSLGLVSHTVPVSNTSLFGTSAFLDSQSSPNGWPSVLPLDNNGEDKSEPQKERGPWRRRKPAANLALVLHNCSFELNCSSEQRERRQSVCSTKNGCNNTSDFDVWEAYSKGTYFSFHFPLPKTFSTMFHLNMCLVWIIWL